MKRYQAVFLVAVEQAIYAPDLELAERRARALAAHRGWVLRSLEAHVEPQPQEGTGQPQSP